MPRTVSATVAIAAPELEANALLLKKREFVTFAFTSQLISILWCDEHSKEGRWYHATCSCCPKT
jgi:hypothetical protein